MLFIIEKQLSQRYRNDVWQILCAADTEFIPPLSSRHYTTQKLFLREEVATQEPIEYFEKMIQQEFILAVENGCVVGFLTYIPDYSLQVDDKMILCDYVSTIVVSKNHRNKGTTRKMYQTLFSHRGARNFVTRTWSVNFTHLHLLETMEFQLIAQIKNDRGQSIDSVYYLKKSA